MKRLTKVNGVRVEWPEKSKGLCKQAGAFCSVAQKCEDETGRIGNRQCPYLQAFDRLASLEDILFAPDGTERITLEQLSELVQAHDDGPVFCGQTVFCVESGRIFENTVKDILLNLNGAYRFTVIGDYYTPTLKAVTSIGKTVFLTRDEAEAALKEAQNV